MIKQSNAAKIFWFALSLLSIAVVLLLSHIWLFCNPIDCSPRGSSVHGFPRQDCRSRLPFPSPELLPNPRIKPVCPPSPAWDFFFFFFFFTTELPGKPLLYIVENKFVVTRAYFGIKELVFRYDQHVGGIFWL